MTKKKRKIASEKQEIAVVDPLKRYLNEVHSYPMLSEQEEIDLFERYRGKGDVEAAKKLVLTHLRLVTRIAFEYRTAYFNVLDLIQEGNVGLLKAVKQFDPTKGARLGHYAQWWIRSYILKFILDNFRLIKLGTTKAQKKLFFNLMREKSRIEAMGYEATPESLAKQLGVSKAQVVEMDRRLTQPEYRLEAPVGKHEGREAILADFIPVDEQKVDEIMADRQTQDILKDKLKVFATSLNEREKKIFEERLLAELPLTLQEIANEYGITKERVRQIEERLLSRLKRSFEESGLNVETLHIH